MIVDMMLLHPSKTTIKANNRHSVFPQDQVMEIIHKDANSNCLKVTYQKTLLITNAQRLPDEVDDTLHQRLERVVSLDNSFAGADAGAAGVCQRDSDGGKNRMERVSSLNSSPAPPFHAVIICPEDHKEMANEMKEYLNKQKLDDGTVAKVATENDIASFGKLEVANFEELLQCANYVFLLVNETFGREFMAQVAVGDSLTTNGPKREYVIPVFMENKSCLPATLGQIKGIDLYLCHNSWKEKIIDFMLILNKACKERKK